MELTAAGQVEYSQLNRYGRQAASYYVSFSAFSCRMSCSRKTAPILVFEFVIVFVFVIVSVLVFLIVIVFAFGCRKTTAISNSPRQRRHWVDRWVLQ